MVAYKEFVQKTGLVGITNILVSLSALILLPILTKNLDILSYGIWIQIIVTVSLIQALTTMGLHYTMLRFLAAETDKKQIQEGFYSIFFTVLFSSVIISLIFFIFATPIGSIIFNNNTLIAQIVAAIIILESLNALSLNYFRTFQQMNKYSIFLITQNYITVLLVTLIILYGYDIVGAAIALLSAKIITFIVMISFIISEIGIIIPKFRNLKGYLEFGLPTLPEYLSTWIINSSDRYLVAIFLGTAFVGYYSPGYALGNMIIMLLSPISLVLPPILYENYDNNNIEGVQTLLKYSLKYFIAISLPAVVIISALSKQILTILSTTEIAAQGYMITPIIAMSALLFGIHAILVEVIFLKKKTKITGTMWTIAASINFGLNLILIPFMGILGAAITTLIAFLFSLIVTAYYSSKYLKFKIDYTFIIKSILSSIFIFLILIIWNPMGLFNTILSIIVGFLIYTIILVLLKSFKKEEIKFFKGLIMK